MFQLYFYLFCFIISSLSVSSQCPSSWTLYKTVFEAVENKTIRNNMYSISATRHMDIVCINNRIKLYNYRFFDIHTVSNSLSISTCTPSLHPISWTCLKNSFTCNNKKVLMTLKNFLGFSCNRNKEISVIVKNCNKIFWTNWIEFTNCSTSVQQIFKRQCLDCDGDVLPYQNQCPNKTTKTLQCRPSWGIWETGECISANCSSTGRRHRTRKCLYADGSKETDHKLCSDSLTNITERCVFDVKDCKNISKNYYVYLSSAVGAALILLFLLLLVVLYLKKNFRKNCLKSFEENAADEVNELVSNRNQSVIFDAYATVENKNINLKENETAFKDKVIHKSCIQNDATSTDNNAVYEFAADVELLEISKLESNTYNNLTIDNNRDKNDYDKLRIDCMSACEKSEENEYDQLKNEYLRQDDFSTDNLYSVLQN